MDATRTRRTRDAARQRWYAAHRRERFARFLGFRPTSLAGNSHSGQEMRPTCGQAAQR